jgi:predicted RNA-binding Zn ribbon-like protein
MSGTPARPALFDLCGGHPALDLVNSLDNRFRPDGPNEMLVRYSDLLRFLEESGLLDAQRVRLLNKGARGDPAELALRSVKDLREAAAAVFYAIVEERTPVPADVRTLERHFFDASRHRELRWEAPAQNPTSAAAPAGMSWQWGGSATDAHLPVWMLSQVVSELLLSDDMARVRTCGVETCRWLFLDTSKNHTRRWCNMKVCGNRMKARRFHARRDS